MATELEVVQAESSGLWQVRDGKTVLEEFERLEDAAAHARAVLLERGKGSMVVYTPSGRPRAKLHLEESDGHRIVEPA
jgi:hypothetical protein